MEFDKDAGLHLGNMYIIRTLDVNGQKLQLLVDNTGPEDKYYFVLNNHFVWSGNEEELRKKWKEIQGKRFKKNPSSIPGLESYSLNELRRLVIDHVNATCTGLDYTIQGVKFTGSRIHGNHNDESDLDVFVQYEGDAREDSMFNATHSIELNVDGISIDINPVKPDDSGRIDEILQDKGYVKNPPEITYLFEEDEYYRYINANIKHNNKYLTIGAISFYIDNDDLIIVNIVVSPYKQREGIGIEMVKRLVQKFPNKNIKTTLRTEDGHKFFTSKKFKSCTKNPPDDIDPNDYDSYEDFAVAVLGQIANLQRGEPEEAMLKVQLANPGLMGYWLEQAGDLTNRLLKYGTYERAGNSHTKKLDRLIRQLSNKYNYPYLEEQMRNNYSVRKESSNRNSLPAGMTFNEYKNKIYALHDQYVEAHKKLPEYTYMGSLAKAIPIAIGQRRFEDALDLCIEFRDLLNSLDDDEFREEFVNSDQLRQIWENRGYRKNPPADGFLYHVTTKHKLKKILASGMLKAGSTWTESEDSIRAIEEEHGIDRNDPEFEEILSRGEILYESQEEQARRKLNEVLPLLHTDSLFFFSTLDSALYRTFRRSSNHIILKLDPDLIPCTCYSADISIAEEIFDLAIELYPDDWSPSLSQEEMWDIEEEIDQLADEYEKSVSEYHGNGEASLEIMCPCDIPTDAIVDVISPGS